MDYHKVYPTKKSAIREIKRLEKKNVELSARTAACNNGKIAEENAELKMRVDALETGIRAFDNSLRDEKKERQIEVENLNGIIDGLKEALKIITRKED